MKYQIKRVDEHTMMLLVTEADVPDLVRRLVAFGISEIVIVDDRGGSGGFRVTFTINAMVEAIEGKMFGKDDD